MDRRLGLAVGDRPLLRDDRHGRQLVEQALGEVVDLGLRRLAPREHAEVDADVPVVGLERDLGEFGHGQGVFPAGRGF